MPRNSKPWYWKARKTWMVTIEGTRHNLGSDKKGAFDKFYELMRRKPKVQSDCVAAVLDDFQTWADENSAERTAKRYADFLQSFISFIGLLTVPELRPKHVTDWLSTKKTWNSTTKRNAITAIQRAFNWAVKNHNLDRNPIQGMNKPEAKKRTKTVSPNEFQTILEHVRDQAFRDLLILSYETGCRPQEIKRLEARHVDLEKHRAVIPAEEAKGGIPRAIYFPTEQSIEIIRRLMKERPTGVLLLNNRGNPWTGFSVKNRMEDLEIAIGLTAMKQRGIELDLSEEAIEECVKTLSPSKKSSGKIVPKKRFELRQEARSKLLSAAKEYGQRFRQYDFRHSFVTRKLVAGVDSHVVAQLAGHKNVEQLHKTYSHVADDYEFMLQNAKREK